MHSLPARFRDISDATRHRHLIRGRLIYQLQPATIMFDSSGIASPSRTQSTRATRTLLGVLLLIGIATRLRQYFSGRSLWLDEYTLALNVIERTFSGFFDPLAFEQRAPVGFLFAERAAVLLLGSSEYALRLVPLIAGIAALILFLAVGKRCVSPTALVVSFALFAICGPAIYYSSEVKQYSSDTAVALLLFALALRPLDHGLSPRRTAVLGLTGAVAIWCSHPAVFVLAGIGATFLFVFLRRGDRKSFWRAALAGTIWVGSFSVSWATLLRQAAADETLHRFWAEYRSFMPLPPRTWSDALWFPENAFAIFANPVGPGSGFAASAFAGLALMSFLTACAVGFERRDRLWLLLSPIPLALLASGFGKYPFQGRLLLFLVPSALLTIGEGVGCLRTSQWPAGRASGNILIALLLLLSAREGLRPQTKYEVRPLLAHIKQHAVPGDLIYGYGGYRSLALQYYLPRLGFDIRNYVKGIDPPKKASALVQDLERLRGHRVWIVFPNLPEDEVFLFRLDAMGPRLELARRPGASAFLYDLRKASAECIDRPRIAELSEVAGAGGR